MKFYTEWRLHGDTNDGHFSNGLTLSYSESTRDMKVVSEDENLTVYEGKHGHTVKCIHENHGDYTLCKTVFENTTDKTARIELLSSFAIKDLNVNRIHRAQSFWSAEGKMLSQNLIDLDMENSWSGYGVRVEKFGQLGSMPVRRWFPFVVLEDTENNEFIGAQIYCASSWQIEVMNRGGNIHLNGGLADRDFGSWFKDVAPGEIFESPKAVVAKGSSIYEVCDKLVKAQKPRIVPVDKDMPIIFNEFCTTWGNPSIGNLERIATRLDGSGVRYLVIDCGWYKPDDGGDWGNVIGDWTASKELFPNGIKEAADMIRSHGLIPGIWFEMEDVASGAKFAYSCEEHHLKRDGYPVQSGARRFWDMRDPWVKKYLSEKVIGQLRENGLGYLKVDYNESIGAGVDGSESYGEGLRQAVCASQDFFRHISNELPELVIENCSSGGHRLEPSMMELVSQASFSDAHECTSIPIIAANLHRLIRPEQSQIWCVLHSDSDIHRINYLLTSTFFGRLCLSGDIFNLSDDNWQTVLNSISFYNKIKHIIKDGFTSNITCTAKDYSKPSGYQYVLRELGNEALLLVHTFKDGADPDISSVIEGYTVKETFGSELDGDFRGKAFILNKNN